MRTGKREPRSLGRSNNIRRTYGTWSLSIMTREGGGGGVLQNNLVVLTISITQQWECFYDSPGGSHVIFNTCNGSKIIVLFKIYWPFDRVSRTHNRTTKIIHGLQLWRSCPTVLALTIWETHKVIFIEARGIISSRFMRVQCVKYWFRIFNFITCDKVF